MKKFLVAFLSLVCVFACAIGLAACGNKGNGNKDNGKLEFELNSDGTSYSVKDCNDDAVIVVIPSEHNGKPVTSIGQSAFYDCSSLTSITIPDSVTSIGEYAFNGCSSLTSITIPDSVIKIDTSPFADSRLSLFDDCTSLESATVPACAASFGTIYNNSEACVKLRTVVITSGDSIHNNAFEDCISLENITIPDTVTSIGEYAFSRCTSLKNITIPNTVTSIGEYAFGGCTSLENITIPDTVTSIGEHAFSKCSSLESLTLPFVGENMKLGNLFYGIPASLKTVITTSGDIGYEAFKECAFIENITINHAATIDNNAFAGCPSLKNVTINGNGETSIKAAFRNCSSLKSATLNEVASIGEDAFAYCYLLSDVVLSDSLTDIGDHAFGGCTSLKELTIPKNVKNIGYNILGSDNSIEKIYFNAEECNDIQENSDKDYGAFDLYNKEKIGGVTVYFGKDVKRIPARLFKASERNLYYEDIIDDINGYTVSGVIFEEGSVCTEIGEDAFMNCKGLEELKLPEELTEIGDNAFYNCLRLPNISLSNGKKLQTIGAYAFYGCKAFTVVAVPESVTAIGEGAFKKCTNVKSIVYGLPGADFNSIFDTSAYPEVELKGNGEIAASAFSQANIRSITLSDKITRIGEYAFYDCSGLIHIELPSSLQSIGNNAFTNCVNLVEVYNPSPNIAKFNAGDEGNGNVAKYAKNVYGIDFSGMRPVSYGASKLFMSSEFLFYDDNGTNYLMGIDDNEPENICVFPSVKAGIFYSIYPTVGFRRYAYDTYVIPSGVAKISKNTFPSSAKIYCQYSSKPASWENNWSGSSTQANVTWNSDVNVPPVEAYIGRLYYRLLPNNTAIVIKQYADFIEGEIEIPETVTYNGKTYRVTEIQNNAFELCRLITDIIIPNSVMSIGEYAFCGCSGLTSITIPDSVTSIGQAAFYGCRAVAELIITGNNIQNIGTGAFLGCPIETATIPAIACSYIKNSELKTVIITGGTSIDKNAFEGCSNLTNVTISNDITDVGINAFEGCNNLQYNEYDNAYYLGNSKNPYVVLIKAKDKSITTCTIHKATKVIYYGAFSGCSSLTSITIPDSVTSIGEYAFQGCSNLISITIPDSVTSIGWGAFYDCSSLTSITIPDSVTSLGEYAFSGCTSLKNITIPDSVTSLGERTFEGCSNLMSITIPDGVTSIGTSAFRGCSSLTSITIPDGVTSIGIGAFNSCSSLTSITIPDSVTSIGWDAFEDCSNLTSITFNGTKAQWNAVKKGSDWNSNTGNYIIHCTDGDIVKAN